MTIRRTSVLTPAAAVDELAAALSARAHYVIGGPASAELAHVLRQLPTWTAYLDGGQDVLSLTGDPESASAVAVVCQLAARELMAVITVPKTVPAATVAAALGGDVLTVHGGPSRHRDLVVLTDGTETRWPVLLVDAIAVVDPTAGLSLHAADLRRQN